MRAAIAGEEEPRLFARVCPEVFQRLGVDDAFLEHARWDFGDACESCAWAVAARRDERVSLVAGVSP